MSKEIKAVHRLIRIEADTAGNAPKKINLMREGHWHTPWHGAFEMTGTDLADMIIHFEEGIGLVAGETKRAPLNYGHDRGGKAAGWITKLYLEADGAELWGDVDWTPEGERAVKEGEYAYISPEWNPRGWAWEDPEEEGKFVENVFTGAALTNIPLFKDLKPVMASAGTGEGKQTKNGGAMDLEQVRAKKLEELSDDEKTFLSEHKAELTDEERTTFELEAEPAEPAEPTEPVEPTEPTEPVQASAKAGISDAELTQLRADAAAGREAREELTRSRMEASADAAVSRGAIKSDQKDKLVDMLVKASAEQRAAIQEFVKALPDNSLLAGELGSGDAGSASAQDELATRSANAVKESAGKLSYADAMKGILASDSGLRLRVEAERNQ